MAFERAAMRDESYGVFRNCKAPPVLSESHTIIQDFRGVQHHYSSPTKDDEYNGSSCWPTKTSINIHANTRAPLPLPLPPLGYAPQVRVHQVPSHTNLPVFRGKVEDPRSAEKPINCNDAAKLYGGFVITEYRAKK